MNYNKELLNLIKLSPCKIIFLSQYDKEIATHGEYDIYTKTINILDSLEVEQKILSLVHEIGHAICDKNKCICLQQYPKLAGLAELHAVIYSLNYCYANKHKKLLSMLVTNLVYNAGRRVKTCHTIAIKQIVKYELFTKCIKMVNSYEQLLLFS